MSRSPYDPSPSYATCHHCEGQYDNSGYYGDDDQSHFCREKALRYTKMAFERFGAELLKTAMEDVELSRAEADRKRKAAEVTYLKAKIEQNERELLNLRQKLSAEDV